MDSVKKFILELNAAQSQVSIPVAMGDTGREWEIALSDGGKPYVIEEGTLAVIEMKRPTGTIYEKRCDILRGEVVRYEFDEHTATHEGVYQCGVVLYKSGKAIATARFIMVVDSRALRPTDYPTIEDEDYLFIEDVKISEADRIEAEMGRAEAEKIRVANEEQRIANEEARGNAEASRETTAEGLFAEVRSTIEGVEEKVAQGVFDGEDGDDGFSPTVTVTAINGGHRVSITDVNGTKSFDILNGAQGDSGSVAKYTVRTDLNKDTYILTVSLLDESGKVVASDEVDFPLESVVVGGDEQNGIITLTLNNGNTIQFDIGDLVEGLVTQSDFDALELRVKALEEAEPDLSNYPTKEQMEVAISEAIGSIPSIPKAEGVSF